MPTSRGRNQLDAASGTIPRRAKTKPNRAVSAARRKSIGSVIVAPIPDRRAVDRADHRLLALRKSAGRAARRRRGRRDGLVDDAVGADRRSVRRPAAPLPHSRRSAAPPDRSAPGAKCALAAPGDDHRAHIVIGVGAVERGDHLAHHLRGEGIHRGRAIERDRQNAVGEVGADLGRSCRPPPVAPANRGHVRT